MNLQHRSGLFDNDGSQYYLEYTEVPFKLICKHLDGLLDVDVTKLWQKAMVDKNIKDGNWVEFILDLCPACAKGQLHPIIDAENVEYKGVTASIEYHFPNVMHVALNWLVRKIISNNQAVVAFYKRVDDNIV